ncbi:MAG: coenzyme F430 synthase [Methanocorpusculum sp.]|nr:coenzyme F430 synthase [Methanocorpusculum sp.]
MRVLVLDTIHGGAVLAEALLRNGDDVDAIDVYRGGTLTPEEAATRRYDVITAPVHLNPDYPLLHTGTPVLSHHEMTGNLAVPLGVRLIEITGARGKTTTAFALAHVMPGRGVLHTSRGTFLYPEKRLLFKKSITPASLLFALAAAKTEDAEWVIAEESAGVTGVGELGILTSERDYEIAAGKKSALEAKLTSLARCKAVLVPAAVSHRGETWQTIESFAQVQGTEVHTASGVFSTPLLHFAGYRAALQTAAAAACVLGIDPSPLSVFEAIEGRMCLRERDGVIVLDNANSGTNAENTAEAVRYLTDVMKTPFVLVIGEEHHAVCEGFSKEAAEKLIEEVQPAAVIFVRSENGKTLAEAEGEAVKKAREMRAAVLLAVKTWR